jgi:putative hydrolase of the HAD superfamily
MAPLPSRSAEWTASLSSRSAEPIRGILFDIDGTLFDTPASMLAAARTMLAELPPEQAREGARIWVDDAQHRYQAYVAGGMTYAEQGIRRVADLFVALGLPVLNEQAATRWVATYREAQLRTAIVFDDVRDGLRGCAGFQIGAVSNNDGGWQRARLRHSGLDAWIGPVVGIDDAGAAKPDPRIYLAGCAALGLEPEHVAYVGDDLALDGQAATEAGLRGIWLDRLGSGVDPGGVPRITTLREVATCVARFGSRPGVR